MLSGVVLVLATTIGAGQAAEAAAPTADDYLAFVRPFFPGTWRYEAISQEGTVLARGEMECQMRSDQRCAVTNITMDGERSSSTAIHGYDPGAKCWRVVQFSPDGSMLVMEVHIDLKVLRAGKYDDVTYSHRNTLTKPDGTQEVSAWKASIVGRKTLELRCVSGDIEGPPVMRFVKK